jgi:hypothetical protein
MTTQVQIITRFPEQSDCDAPQHTIIKQSASGHNTEVNMCSLIVDAANSAWHSGERWFNEFTARTRTPLFKHPTNGRLV